MAIIPSSYQAPKSLFNKHIETIYPYLFRRVRNVKYVRERITTPDNDFLDIDWLKKDNRRLMIISHGLEGNSDSKYIKGMARAFSEKHWDVLAWNYRGCSGEPNRKAYAYHAGATHDLSLVIQHALKVGKYDSVCLIGISLGGNLTLKYLGEQSNYVNEKIKSAIVFSTPCDLKESSFHLSKGVNQIYAQRFLASLKQKVKDKAKVLPEQIDIAFLKDIRTLTAFDNVYTAPIHGFIDALDYYTKCSSKLFIPYITVPTLIVNAENDSFLTPACYPIALARNHAFVYLEMPKQGGHIGFYTKSKIYWSEKRALDFAELHL
ncbi:MAG: YheT family hydrolase [Chitinophagales bacterium]